MKKDNLKKVWIIMWPAAILLYISYFLFSFFSVYIANIMGQFVDHILVNNTTSAKSMLIQLLAAFVISIFVMPLLDLWANIASFRRGLIHDKIILSEFMKKKFSDMRTFSTGTASRRLQYDPIVFRTSVVMTPTRCVAYLTTLIVTVVLMFHMSFIQSLILMFLVGLSLISTFTPSNKMAKFAEERKCYEEKINSDRLDLIQYRSFFHTSHIGSKEVKYLSDSFIQAFQRILKREIYLIQSLDFFRELILLLGIIFLFVWKIFFGGDLSVGEMITMYSYFISIKTLTNQICGHLKDFAQIPKAIARIEELVSNKEKNYQKCLPKEWNQLYLKHGFFSYVPKKMIINDLSFRISKGEFVHIKGQNGAGKSTLINLLCQLETLDKGEFYLDKIPLKAFSVKELRNQIGIMNQFPDLFPGTLYENVRIANLNANNSEIAAVLNKVGLLEMKSRVLTGTREELSGGEQKKLSLARLLLKNNEIIILDEPFEFLDENGRFLIKNLLLDQQKTRIIISHSNLDFININSLIDI